MENIEVLACEKLHELKIVRVEKGGEKRGKMEYVFWCQECNTVWDLVVLEGGKNELKLVVLEPPVEIVCRGGGVGSEEAEKKN